MYSRLATPIVTNTVRWTGENLSTLQFTMTFSVVVCAYIKYSFLLPSSPQSTTIAQ